MSQDFTIAPQAHHKNMTSQPEPTVYPQHMSARNSVFPSPIPQTHDILANKDTSNKSSKNTISTNAHFLDFIYSRMSMNTLEHMLKKKKMTNRNSRQFRDGHKITITSMQKKQQSFAGTICGWDILFAHILFSKDWMQRTCIFTRKTTASTCISNLENTLFSDHYLDFMFPQSYHDHT